MMHVLGAGCTRNPSASPGVCGLGMDVHSTGERVRPAAGEQVLVFLTKVTGISHCWWG